MIPSDKSPVTGLPVPAFYIHASNECGHFQENNGRTLLLRGINFCASAKQPVGQAGAQLDGFWESAKSGEMSFVGRVLDLDSGDADIHLTRLREWGFNVLRYVFTWEAIEHAGPGRYDQEYIQYTVRVLQKCKDFGFRVYMDPHQDLFSRFSGGSGAPYWALVACGLNPECFTATNAAVIQCEYPDARSPAPETFPDMIWASNYTRLACLTIFTMFFAGRDFAPLCVLDDVNIQDWLQTHYFNAVGELGKAIASYDGGSLLESCVIGWDSLNEPNGGLTGVEEIGQHSKEEVLQIGPMPTPFEAMRLGMGEKMSINNYRFSSTGPKKTGDVEIDPRGIRAWLLPDAEPLDEQGRCKRWGWKRDAGWKLGSCVWALHGVWDLSTKELLKPNYFRCSPQRSRAPIDFGRDYWMPHWQAYAKTVRAFHPEAILFIHPPVLKVPPKIDPIHHDLLSGRAVFSTHFYDGVTLVTKHWNFFNFDALGYLRGKYKYKWQAVKVGEKAIRACLQEQLGVLKQDGLDALGRYPIMMGEIGIPYDLDKGRAFENGDYSSQIRALDATLNACDGPNSLNRTIWTYCPDNTHKEGDRWNGEDLSIWSKDDQDRNREQSIHSPYMDAPATQIVDGTKKDIIHLDLNDGARALPAFCRPYPTATVGTPTLITFDIKSSEFRLELSVGPEAVQDSTLATEIYVPMVHYAASPSSISQPVREHLATLPDQNETTSVLLSDQSDTSDLLALDVTVSSGRWEVKGQTLYWYHGQPASSEGPGKEVITIKRSGGAVPLWAEQFADSGGIARSVCNEAMSCCCIQ